MYHPCLRNVAMFTSPPWRKTASSLPSLGFPFALGGERVAVENAAGLEVGQLSLVKRLMNEEHDATKLAHRGLGPPPPPYNLSGKRILVEALHKVADPRRLSTTSQFGTPDGVLRCSMSPQFF